MYCLLCAGVEYVVRWWGVCVRVLKNFFRESTRDIGVFLLLALVSLLITIGLRALQASP